MLIRIKILFVFGFIFLLHYFPAKSQSTNCTNSNFELGDFSNWQGGTGTPNGNSGNNPGGCCQIVINNILNSGGLIPPRHTITNPITDPNTFNNLNQVAPGGNFSARLGSWQNSFYAQNNPGPFPGSKAEMLRYTFTVTPASELFVYQYAVVLEDPNYNVTQHSHGEKPRFEISVLDQAGNYVPNALCGHYLVVADSNNAGFLPGILTSASQVHYKNWTTVGINLTAYMGQVITIEFKVGDCALGGHFGYAYIDAYCAPLEVLAQYCVGQNQVVLTAPPGFSYLWMPGGFTTQTITINNPQIGAVYTCDLTSITGCVATISTIVQPTLITPNFGYQVDCNLNTVLFFDSTTVQNGTASNWSWNFGDNSTVMNGVQNPVHTYSGPGTYNVTLTITSVAGCQASVTIPITIPLVTVDAPSSTICATAFVTINASGASSYEWSPSTGLNVTTGATVQASPTVSTTYTVTGYNVNGCSGTTTAFVHIAPNLVVNVTAVNDSLCMGQSTVLNAMGGTNYTWSPSIYLNSTTGTTVISSAIANITYTVFVTNASGCSGQASIPITSLSNPVVSLNNPAACLGQSAVLNANGALSYQWSNGSTGNSISVSPIVNTNYTVIGSDGFCSDTASGLVTINPLPIVNAAPNGNICLGGSIQLNATGASTYTWSPSTGLDFSTGSIVNSTPITSTTYTVTGTDLNGCSALAPVTIIVNNPPVISVVATDYILCIGSNATLTASGASTYSWAPSTGLSASTGSSVLANPILTTTYTVIGVNAFSCADTTTINIVVSPGPPISLTSTNPIICVGGSTTLTATGASTYSWSPAVNLNTSTGSVVVASPIVTTTYQVAALDAFGCAANAVSIVIVNPLPIINSTSTGNICATGTVQLGATGATTYQWSPSTGLSATNGNSVNATISNTTTYTVVGIDVNGCSAVSSVVVNVFPDPVISATANSTILCTSSSATLNASGAINYSWSPSAGLSSSTGSSVQTTPSASVTYTVIGIDLNGCADTATINITVSPAPPITIASTNPIICSGDNTTLTASGANTFTWSPSSSLNASTGSVVIASPITTTTYTVLAIDTSGCIANSISTVVVNPIPVIGVTPIAPALCFGEATSLTANGASTYTWSPSTGLSVTVGTYVTAYPSVTTTYTVVGSSASGCTALNSVVVNVFPNPVLNVLANNPQICFGQSAILTASGALTYIWSPSFNLSSSTGSSVNATPNSTTIYTIIGADVNGCTSAANTSIIVNPNPIVNAFSNTVFVCLGTSASLGANGANFYSWSPSTGLSNTTGNIIQAIPNTAITYTVTGTNLYGCTDTAMKSVYVNPLPVLSISSTNPVMCVGDSATLIASGAVSYTWSPITFLNSSTGASVIANPNSTIYYIVAATDSNGCVGFDSSIINVNPLPVIITSGSDSFCLNQSITISASGATVYNWSPSTGLSGTTGNSVTASPITSTTYTVSGTDVNGCSALDDIPVTVNPLPIVIASTTTPTLCLNTSALLTATGAVIYNWSPSINLSSSIGDSVIASPTTSTTYSVTGIDLNGCTATSSQSILINTLPVIAGSDSAICFGFSTPLNATGASTYTWTPGTNLSSTIGATIIANPVSTITYTITGTDVNGCTGISTSVVIINPLPIINVSAVDSTFCLGQSTTLNSSGATVYSWSPSTGLNNTTGNSVIASPTNSITYTVSGTDVNGCSALSNIPVTVNPLPIVIASTSTPTLCLNATASLTVTGASTYTWSPSISLSASTGSSVIASPTSSTTYSVTGTDLNGCTATSTQSILTNSFPIISGTDSVICFGFSTPLNAAGANTYTWSPGTNLSSTNGATVIANPISTITYTITGTDVNGCTGISTSIVIINPLPIITVTAVDSTFCLGQSTTLNSSGATVYNWSPSTGLSATTGISVIASPTSSTTYTVSGVDVNGCSALNNIPVTVNPLPIVIASTATPTLCLNASATLTATGASTYNWSPSASLSASTGSSVIATPTSTITYSVTGTDLNGCTASSTLSILINTLPLIAGSDSAICFGFSTPLIATGASTYTWSPATNLSSTNGATVIATPASTITYTITGTDLNGCTGGSTSIVIINPLPIINATAINSTFCLGQSTILNASGASVYNWSPSTGLSATTGSFVSASPSINSTYTVTGSNSFGCVSSNTISVVIYPLPVVNITPNTPAVCPGEFAILTVTGALNYLWSTNALGNTIAVNPIVNTLYSVIGTDVNGCTASDSTTVIINPVPIISAQAQQSTLCIGQSTSITASGAVTYSWSPSNGLSATSGSMVIATPGLSLTYTIIGTNATGCKDTTTISLIVNSLPSAAAGVDENICEGSSVQLNASGGTTYEWSPATGLSSTNIADPIASPTSTISYIVIVANLNGCFASDTIQVVVHPYPVIDAGPAQTVCYPNSTQLQGSGASIYSWLPVLYLNNSQIQNPACIPLSNITYTLTGTDNFGCMATDTVSIKLMMPFQIIASSDVMICYSESIQLFASGGNNYQWTPPDGLDNTTIANPTASPSNTTTYIVTSTDGVCFTSSDSVVVTVIQIPEIFAGADAEMIYGQTYQLNAFTNGGSILWEPSTFLDCATCEDPIASHVNIPITYKLTVTDSFGCKAEDYIKINLACDDDVFFIPNTFTPNGNGKNDIFRIRTYGLSYISAFRVFNRWGEMVFETYDVNEGWDGTWQGKLCTPAVYVWYIQGTCANGVELRKKGNVTLIR